MKQPTFIFPALFMAMLTVACQKKNDAPDPWGMNLPSESAGGQENSNSLQLDDIIANGELIMVTLSGPDTYYDYHGKGMGLHYLLLEEFCTHIGVQLRVDVCKDTADMIDRLRRGEADVLALPMTKAVKGLKECVGKASDGKWHWLVGEDNTSLSDTLNAYVDARLVKKVREEQDFWLSSASVTRRVFSPMLNRSKGIISEYDHLFQRYAPVAGWDWRLLAALCYQESTFDARAHSWAGACGLMQIMPSTAKELGLPMADIYHPEKNIAASTRYIAKLTRLFSDVSNSAERMKFVMASYNGGSFHVRDAMALARKHGGSPYLWSDVQKYILALQKPEYYNDPVVKNGYMRGSETAQYVERIWGRWMDYRGVKGASIASPSATPSLGASSPIAPDPHPSKKRKAKYNL